MMIRVGYIVYMMISVSPGPGHPCRRDGVTALHGPVVDFECSLRLRSGPPGPAADVESSM